MWAAIKKAINSTLGKKLKPLDHIIEEQAHETFYNNMQSYVNAYGDNGGSILIVERGTESVDFEESNENAKVVILPIGVKEIGRLAFNGWVNLKSIVIPFGCEDLPGNAFRDCSSLLSVKIPKTVKRLGEYTFANCSSLKSVEIPYSVEEVGIGAFLNCENLKKISIPNGITGISRTCFYGCNRLEKLYIPKSVTVIAKDAFMNAGTSGGLSIFYDGTTEDWYSIRHLWEEGMSGTYSLITVYCSDDEIYYDYT